MFINFETILKDLDGKPLFGQDSGLGPDELPPMTLSTIAVTSLVTLTQEDQSVDAKTKYDWGHLANMIHDSKGEIDLQHDQLQLLKNRIGKLYGPLIVVQAWDLLEGKNS